MSDIIPIDAIQSKILTIRNQKVMLDSDLAELYGVETKYLNRQVKRNISRFPDDFMFQLTETESALLNLRCQIGTSSHGGRRYLPFAFTDNGIAMLSSILNSKRAIAVNIQIMRIFTNLRKFLINPDTFHLKIQEYFNKVDKHDAQIQNIINAVNTLIAENMKLKPVISKNKQPIGFKFSKSGKPD